MIIEFLKNILINYNCSEYFDNIDQKNMYSDICNKIPEEKIYKMIEILLDATKSSKTTNNIKLIFELAIIKIIELESKEEVKVEIKDIPVLEEKKEIKNEVKIEKKELSSKLIEKLEVVKKIRINNALANFNKKQLLDFKKKFDSIKELLMDPDYSSIISLMLDGDIKVKGEEYLIFVYESQNLDEYFNSILLDIEKILKKVFNYNLKPIAISNSSWEIIKTKFNNSLKEKKKIYNYIEENYNLEEIFKIEEEQENVNSNNELENIFEYIIVYN